MRPKKRILVVDDDTFAAAPLERYLLMAGYDVVSVPSGAAALEWLRQSEADLIILDVLMPGLSGFEVCRSLREQKATEFTPVVFLTARNRVADMTEGGRAGSDLYLIKPVLPARLLTMVSLFLSSEAPLARRRAAPEPAA